MIYYPDICLVEWLKTADNLEYLSPGQDFNSVPSITDVRNIIFWVF